MSEEQRFLNAINAAFEKGGAILIPVFALGKTQEVLAMVYRFRRNGQLNHTPVYIGGLSTKITTIHDELARGVPRQLPGLSLLEAVQPFVLNSKEIDSAQVRPNRLFALSSGMMTEKTLSNILAARFLSEPKHSVFFVGYADPDSPGGRLKAALPDEPFRLNKDLPSQPLTCSVQEFSFSAHASRETLLDYIRQTKPRVVFLVHGDPPSVNWFKAKIDGEFAQTRAIIPEPGRVYEV
jgi:predicted metal-dependent RNase